MLIALASGTAPNVSEVGGKAASLMRLSAEGHNVPPGAVITAAFFEPWFRTLAEATDWQDVLSLAGSHNNLAALHAKCEIVKDRAGDLTLDDAQTDAFNTLRTLLPAGESVTFAVRSSSPEEDLAGASFAGQYETVLGVTRENLEAAIRACFVSSLDARVIHYKREMGFDLIPRIAVVVQQMIDSDTAGVAFSINPLTNDYDEVLINAAFGLGEALVSGEITPDSIVANKLTGEIIEYRVGTKADESGSDTPSLSAEQVHELVGLVTRIEGNTGEPVDIEWAFCAGDLYVLQSRPVTGYVPLHKDLQTAPDEIRHLYIDGFLTDGITMSTAISPMSTSVFEALGVALVRWMTGLKEGELALKSMGIHLSGGRMYIDFNLFATVYGKQDKVMEQAERMNPFYVAMFTSSEIERYDRSRPPGWTTLRMITWGCRILWHSKAALTKLIGAWWQGPRFKARYDESVDRFEQHITRPVDLDEPLGQGYWEDMVEGGRVTLNATYPATVLVLLSQARIRSLAGKDEALKLLADDICAGYEEDMVVQMGLRMHELAMMLPRELFDDLTALADRIVARDLPGDFLAAWDGFVARFGVRGPLEMEIANDRYGDSPMLVLGQMATIAASGGTFDPHQMHADKVARRQAAFREMSERLSSRKRRILERCYQRCIEFSGAREYFKHHVLQMYVRLRQKLLHHAERFVATGRLDVVNDIFDVTMDDVDHAIADPDFDLRGARAATTFQQQQRERVPAFPMFIDSRGRIPRITVSDVPDDLDENTVVGVAVSPGVTTGRVKRLLNPFEKQIEPGDVLVAMTTDPGWTPLFINAAAVVLEIGGELQHGALVAREYGKPCVSSIPRVMDQFEDGQLVEVDGDRGLVRILEQPPGPDTNND